MGLYTSVMGLVIATVSSKDTGKLHAMPRHTSVGRSWLDRERAPDSDVAHPQAGRRPMCRCRGKEDISALACRLITQGDQEVRLERSCKQSESEGHINLKGQMHRKALTLDRAAS